MIYFCALLSDIGDAIIHAFRILFAKIAILIYNGIVWAYDLFTYISRAEILDNDFVNEIYRKVGLILGLFMLFKLVFTLIQSLIDPNKFSDKKNGFGQIIMRSIIAIVLLGITPTIFKEAFRIQNLIVGSDNNNNVIYKLIIGKRPNVNATSFGKILASEVFFSFYTDEEEPYLDFVPFDLESGDSDITIDNITSIKEAIESGRSFSYAMDFVGGKKNKKYVIEFDEIFCVAIGVVIFWMVLMYCIQISIRVFQLAYLQLIAPIPILSYISDPEGAFQKWIKQCSTTFLDLFIRLAIIYFCTSLINEIVNQLSPSNVGSILQSSLNLPENSGFMLGIIKVFLIIGLLLFAKRVPELLKDLFPNMTGGGTGFSFGLNPKKTLNDTLAAGLIGGVAGFAGGAASNLIHGGINTYRGTKKAFIEEKNNGGNVGKRILAGSKAFGKGFFKTGFSTMGGAAGGVKAGIKTKDFTKSFDAVNVTNANREKRELKAAAGYHWYNPIPTIEDKILGFAGETTGAEKKIKEAEWQQKSLEASRGAIWKFAEDEYKKGTLDYDDYSFFRSLQKQEKNGKVVWRGIKNGSTIEIDDSTLSSYTSRNDSAGNPHDYATEIRNNATVDEGIKKQGKIIKGLEKANSDAKKK